MLITLLMSANNAVSVTRLYETVWGDSPPTSARATLLTYVLRLRQQFVRHGLAHSPVQTVPGGYLINADTASLDLLDFRNLILRARRCRADGDQETELRFLNDALALWQGPPLANVRSDVLHREEVPKLIEEWLEAMERRIAIELACGRHRSVIADLRALTSRHPEREIFEEQLVEALYRAGRQVEALEECRRFRRYLLEDLGIDPGARLQHLELAILRGESLDEDRPGPGDGNGASLGVDPRVTNCQIPFEVPDFIGRVDLSARIRTDQHADMSDRRPALALVRGIAGVGKTALAVRLAHEMRQSFPEGQWFVSLTDGSGEPRRPDGVLADLLRNLGVGERGIPADLVARAAAFRAAMTDRRILLLFDDVTDTEQVLPLLPGTSGSAVIMTSRRSLISLTALYGVRSYLAEPLAPQESVELLARIIGHTAVDAERSAAAELAELCGHLPLALRIAAARINGRRGASLAASVGWLGSDVLANLSLGPGGTSVRQVFQATYERLSVDAQTLLRRIGVADQADLTDDQISRLGSQSLPVTQDIIDELYGASLLRSDSPGWYSMNGLVRAFVRESVSTV